MSQNDLNEVLAYKMKDADLLSIADLANKHNSGIGITLFVKGALVTGVTVSGREYYETQIKALSEVNNDTSQLLSQHFSEGLSYYQAGENESFEYPQNFLHLKEASFTLGGGKLNPLPNSLLRIKIEEIDGFILGQYF
ncbi:gas vesicle accessory protein GvpU [Pantoea hericii]|uniref:gas vesicle accessory protein GvpU n=1 Tax=Pantoea hericii TaxID=1815628 RepID=UPI0015FE1AAE|nr:gas vesicle accessory protein GvpU [Pantoea hericii]